MNGLSSNGLRAVSAIAAVLLATACVDTEKVFVEVPAFEDPPSAALGFLGYTNSESKTPVCGNCHVGQHSEWKGTAHATAWEDLQDSGHSAESCEGCHSVGALGNAVTDPNVGYAATRDERYHDVQCESCHGPGLDHVTNPDNDANKPLASLVVTTGGASACGECHQGTHNPFIEEWSQSRHGQSTENHAVDNVDCGPCHEGRGILAAWGVKANYVEKDEQEPIAIGCPICHDPHDPTNSKQLRFPINTPNVETNLCMKCHHRRSEPDPNSSRGPHSPQGPLLVGEGVGWIPPNFQYPTVSIVGTHGSEANPRLCATCHVSRLTVTDEATGAFSFQSVGHLFKAIPCLDSTGKPTTDDSCTLTERTFSACAASGCHTETSARSALIVSRGRIESLADQITALLAQVPASELVTGDNLITTAEGARFNRDLGLLGGTPIHNPFLIEALLTASIKQMKTDYGLTVPAGLVLENTLGTNH
jgi:predicted CXXCH cytochrome family protein